MKIFKEIEEIKKEMAALKESGKKVGFVPTMGAIHEGHLSLVREARRFCDIVVMSIFINKKQFNNPQDYKKYPQTLEADIKKLTEEKIDLLFIPDDQKIYPKNDPLLHFQIKHLTDKLCGKDRPGHFEGVAVIISKLFNIVKPDLAFFGEKDFQQLQVIRQITKDLDFDTKIIGCDTIREKTGLALSSRNLRLSDHQRIIAPQIYQTILGLKRKILENNHLNLELELQKSKKELLSFGFEKIDYLEVRNEDNLETSKNYDKRIKSRIFIALYLNEIRLIDNIKLY